MVLSLPSIIRLLVRAITVLMVLLGASLLAQAQIIHYVKPTATGNGSGSNWANASGDLQATITTSSSGQQVWVAAGTYKPGGNANTERTISFAMKDGVTIYGGFAGSETSLSQRPAVNLTTPSSTTLSGDIDNSPADNSGNSCHVIRNPPGLTTSAVLDGFVITGGNANGGDYIYFGGGMFNPGGDSPTVRNCSFLGNSATMDGGAIYNNRNGSPVLTNCSFQGNSAAIYGGAIYYDGSSSPTLTNCSLLNNSASQLGGAIFNRSSSPTLTNCSLQSNNAPNGGAIANVSGSNSTLTNCSLQSNSASQNGGAIYNDGSRVNLTNCVIWGNGGASTFNNQQLDFITTSYSLFESSVTFYSPGTGNLTTTVPPFLSTTDARLNACAPAINTGDNAANRTTTDLAGNPRLFNGGRIDMGAYEYQGQGNSFSVVITAVPSLTITTGQSTTLIASAGSSQPADAYIWSTGATSNSIVVSVAGPYSVTAATTAGCSATASVTLTVNPPACGAGLSGPIWTGCLSTDWNTAGNWASGAVPIATDDVVIPSAPANQPVLSTTVTAKSVEVQSGASLSITASGSLTSNNLKSLDGNTTAFSNRGTVQNAGQLVLGNTAAIGQIGFWNRGVANNAGGQISIDRSQVSALRTGQRQL